MTLAQHALFLLCAGASGHVQNLTGFAVGLGLLGLVGILHVAPLPDVANVVSVLTLVNAAMLFRAQPPQIERPRAGGASESGPMSLVSTLQFIAGHPLNRHRRLAALLGFAKWQFGARLVPGRVVFDWVNGARFIVRRGETGLTGNMYCGLHEFADMAYLLHTMSPDDLFVDVGANVGSYTLLACAAKGARGICFEPVPDTYRRLLDNLRLNDLPGRVRALNLGLSDRPGELRFTAGENCMNHVLAAGESAADAVKVDVLRLDDALQGESPAMLKIDVEGFETPVIAGAARVLAQPTLHSVIMELNGSGERYGFSEDAILATMARHGFETFAYEPFSRTLRPADGRNAGTGNTLFVRDVDRVRQRIAAAPRIEVAGVAL